MKLDINKILLTESTPNIYQIFHDNTILKFWTPDILVPFGIDNEYNKYLLKLEFDDSEKNSHFKKIILHIEKLIKEKIGINENEFKSCVKTRLNKKDLLECRLKSVKNNIITSIEYMNKEEGYLKTIYDIPKLSMIKAQIEINGLWDYRGINSKETNNAGLIIYIHKIIVY